MNDNDLGRLLFGRDPDRLSVNTRSSPERGMSQITVPAVSDSSGGFVELSVSGEVLEVPTTFAVKKGDEVIVSLAKSVPTVIGVVGKGDKVDNLVASTIKATTAIVSKVIAGSVSADTITAVEAYIDSLKAGDFAADSIEATTANVVNLIAKDAKFDSLSATKAVIGTLETAKAFIEELTAKEITAEKLEAATAYIGSLTAEDVTAEQIAAGLATIGTLEATYANIDFANVDVANIGELFAKSGIIQDIVTESGTVTGRLVGVTIVGDLIEAGTLKADKLVVKGEDGLYYKLNVDAEGVEGEQTDYNSINGKCIQAQSITATKISVSDLVAFGATIGGLVIEDGSLHSFAKDAHDSGANGFFLGADGSAGLGGASSYVRYDAEADSLDIKARSVSIDSTPVAKRDEALGDVQVQYALSSSETAPPSDGWSATAPARQPGKYVWQRTVATKADGSTSVSAATCISGADGNPGADGKTSYLHIAYATNATGTSGFSTTDSAGKTHIGTYTDFAVADSTDPKKYAWTKIKGETGDKGDKGEKGKGVSGVDVKYYLSTSATALIGGEWTTDAPAWVNGRYMWSKTVTTYSDGSSDESAPVNITGAKGPSGATGIGVKAIVEQYYLSTSSSAQAGGSWTDACPAWATGKYLWTRSSVTWTDSTVTYTDPVLAGAINSANQNAANAAKTATNYMEYTSAGLDVGNKSSGKWAGFRTRMTFGAFQVLNAAGTVLASYGDKAVELGRNAADSVISMCGGAMKVLTTIVGGKRYSRITTTGPTAVLGMEANRSDVNGGGRVVVDGSKALLGYNDYTALDTLDTYDASLKVGISSIDLDASTIRVMGDAAFYSKGGQYVGNFKYVTAGTAAQDGLNQLVVGNSTPTGNQGNAKGALYLYGAGKGYTRLMPSNATDSHTYLNLSSIAGTGTLPAYKALYSNASGTTGTVTLSETAANFSMLEIFFKANDGDMSSVRIWAPNGKVANLSSSRITMAAGAGWTKSKQISISGKTLAYTGYAGESGIGNNSGGTNYVGSILICYVLGWK